jgi:hypothetical protein
MRQPYWSQILNHLGLVAGICYDLGIGDVLDHATQPNPEMRMVPVGNAVKARVLNGLGLVNHQCYLVPMLFQNTPTHRLLAPGIAATHLLCGGPRLWHEPTGRECGPAARIVPRGACTGGRRAACGKRGHRAPTTRRAGGR